jgi:hypothetical protein
VSFDDTTEILELFAEAQAGAAEFFADSRVITRSGRGEPVKIDAAYFREWRKKNPERSAAIARTYRCTRERAISFCCHRCGDLADGDLSTR